MNPSISFIDNLKRDFDIDLPDNNIDEINGIKVNIEDSSFSLEIMLKNDDSITYESEDDSEVDGMKYMVNDIFDSYNGDDIYFEHISLNSYDMIENGSVLEYDTQYGHMIVKNLTIKVERY